MKTRGGRYMALLLALLFMVTALHAVCAEAPAAGAQRVIHYAQQVYAQEMEGRTSVLSYVNALRNQKQYALRTLNRANLYNEIYDLGLGFACTLIDIQLAVLSQDPSQITKSAIDVGMPAGTWTLEHVLSQLGVELLPDVSLSSFVYGEAALAADRINTAGLLEIMERVEKNGGVFASEADAREFLRIQATNRIGFAALDMARGYYMDQLNSGVFGAIGDLVRHISLSGISGMLATESIVSSYVAGTLTDYVGAVLDRIAGAAENERVTAWIGTVKQVSAELDSYLQGTAKELSLVSVAAPAELDAYLGRWASVDMDDCTLALDKKDGSYYLSAVFYRMAAFEAEYAGLDPTDMSLVFKTPDGSFTCSVELMQDTLSVFVETKDDFGSYFHQREWIYVRTPADGAEGWIGVWTADTGEYLEIYSVDQDGVVIVYNGLTASGQSYFSTSYTLRFEDEQRTTAAEEEAVILQKGWRYRFVLEDDRIVMQSRSPEKSFYRNE